MVMDTSYLVETPEGIDLQAELAGPAPRVLAYAFDWMIRTAILAIAGFAVALLNLGGLGVGILLITSFVLEWFYPVYFEVVKQGQTPGKKRMHLAVVNEDLTPIRFESSVIRNLLRAADFLPFFYIFGLTSMCISGRFQRLGDIAASTIVIHRPAPQEYLSLPDAVPVTPPAGIDEDEQRALIDFARRHQELSTPRQEELANILSPVTGRSGAAAVERIRGMGNWLAGKR